MYKKVKLKAFNPKIIIELMTQWYLGHERLAFLKKKTKSKHESKNGKIIWYTMNALTSDTDISDIGSDNFVDKAIRYQGFIIIRTLNDDKSQKHFYIKILMNEAIDYWFLYTS